MILSLAAYVGPHAKSPDWNAARVDNAIALLLRVNALIAHLETVMGIVFRVNPGTGTCVSGKTFGGFRPQDCPQGAPTSSHKDGAGVDLYDPDNKIDDALDDALLEKFHLYREHPSATARWCHLTTRAPRSGRRTFLP